MKMNKLDPKDVHGLAAVVIVLIAATIGLCIWAVCIEKLPIFN